MLDAADAFALALGLLGTDAAADGGQGAVLGDDLVGGLKVALGDLGDELRDVDLHIVQKEVDGLKDLGVKIETNAVIGRSITIDELMEEFQFEAVFIGSGAGLPMFMHIPGENLKPAC